MATFTINRFPYDSDFKLYSKSRITINPGVTCLIGPNGSGKSTLIKMLEQKLKDRDDASVLSFDNLNEGGSASMSAAAFRGDLNFLATVFNSSEGEGIIANIGRQSSRIGTFMRNEAKNYKEVWFLFDAVDSGLSIDNIQEVKTYLFEPILNDCKKYNVDGYIVLSANQYECTAGADCICMHDFKHRIFKTYNGYKKYILKCAEYIRDRNK